MIQETTLQYIDQVAAKYNLHPLEVRELLSERLPGWIATANQGQARALLWLWLNSGKNPSNLLWLRPNNPMADAS